MSQNKLNVTHDLMRKCLRDEFLEEYGKKVQSDNSLTVKFIVSPEKYVFHIERYKLRKFVHSMDQFDVDEYPVNVNVYSFQVFADMLDGKDIVITSIKTAFELVEFAEKVYCLKLHCACNEYLRLHYNCDQAPQIYEYAKANGLLELADNCLEYITVDFATIIESESFFSLGLATVADLLNRNWLGVSEMSLLKALIKYARRLTVKDVRSHMRMAVDKIRFQDLEAKELLRMKGIEHILSPEDLLKKLKVALEKCSCQQQDAIRDGCKTISIEYEDKKTITCNFTIVMLCNFTQDLILKSLTLNDTFLNNIDINKMKMEIGNQKTLTALNENTITVDKEIKAGDTVELKVHLKQSQKIILGKPLTKSPGFTIIPHYMRPLSIPLIDQIEVKCMQYDTPIDLHWKCSSYV